MKKMETNSMKNANGGLGYWITCGCGAVTSFSFTKLGAFRKHYKHQKKYLNPDGTLQRDHRGLTTSW